MAVRGDALETMAPGVRPPPLPEGTEVKKTCQQARYFPVSLSVNTDEVLEKEKREARVCENG